MSDDHGFERFVREQTPTLYRTALLLTGNRYDAEELLQDTLARLYPKWGRVMAADKPIAYVQRCVGNRAVSRRRAPEARAESRWEMPDGWDGSDVGETVAVSRTVWHLLGTLPTKQRAALVLRYLYDLPEVTSLRRWVAGRHPSAAWSVAASRRCAPRTSPPLPQQKGAGDEPARGSGRVRD
jgi:DNA-directed RNA polymerase specialized sigma24 family protein